MLFCSIVKFNYEYQLYLKSKLKKFIITFRKKISEDRSLPWYLIKQILTNPDRVTEEKIGYFGKKSTSNFAIYLTLFAD